MLEVGAADGAAAVRSAWAGVTPLELPKVNSVTARAGRQRLVAFVAITLVVFGIVMVGSASSGELLLQGLGQWSLLIRQGLFGIIGLSLFWFAMRVPLEMVRRLARPLVWISVALVGVTMIPALSSSRFVTLTSSGLIDL